jgi:hypothetical protein
VQLSEGITINENLLDLQDNEAITVRDSFITRNFFNGPQVGFQCEYQFWYRWFIQATAKVAVGNMHQRVTISGRTTVSSPPGAPAQAAAVWRPTRTRRGRRCCSARPTSGPRASTSAWNTSGRPVG